MKYLYGTILTIALTALPMMATAAPDPHTNITPVEELVSQEIAAFNAFVTQEPAPSDAEIATAIEDILGILASYQDILDR